MHIYDAARFPPSRPGSRMQANAGVADYRRLQQRIGTTRTVVVQPAAYGTDNAVTLDAIARLGNARGVAVVFPDVGDGELRALDAGGVRGIRFTVFDPATAVTRIDMIEPLARRMADIGWHVQIHMRGDQIVATPTCCGGCPRPSSSTTWAAVPLPEGTSHAAFKVVRELLDKGNAWVKLSGAYQDTKIGPPTYADATALARAYVAAAPERMVWGSDWPHPTETDKPDDALLLDLLSEWAPDARPAGASSSITRKLCTGFRDGVSEGQQATAASSIRNWGRGPRQWCAARVGSAQSSPNWPARRSQVTRRRCGSVSARKCTWTSLAPSCAPRWRTRARLSVGASSWPQPMCSTWRWPSLLRCTSRYMALGSGGHSIRL
jgi:predicted TIM-barrel fold metal-dependent hydrolase